MPEGYPEHTARVLVDRHGIVEEEGRGVNAIEEEGEFGLQR